MTATDSDIDFDFAGVDSEFITPDPEDTQQDTINPDAPNVPDDFIEQPKETARAKQYRLKAKKLFNFLIKAGAGNPATVADSAAMIQYGPGVTQAFGQLADKDERVRKMVDLITDDGIDNPYLIMTFATIPLLFQFLRNHEPKKDAINTGINIKIPFTKRKLRIPINLKIRFTVIRNNTYAPDFLTQHVFGNPAIQQAMQKQGIQVAWPPVRR